jgi:hypothetical protein
MSIMEDYRSKRLTKRIRLKDLAELLDCTIGLISNWGNNRCSMSQVKVNSYMEYIDGK